MLMDYVLAALEALLPLFKVLLTIASSVLVVVATNWVSKKFGINISLAQQAQVNEAVKKAIAFGEEWARTEFKKTGTKPEGAQKLNAALVFLQQEAERLGLMKQLEGRLEQMLLSALGQQRLVQDAPVVMQAKMTGQANASGLAGH